MRRPTVGAPQACARPQHYRRPTPPFIHARNPGRPPMPRQLRVALHPPERQLQRSLSAGAPTHPTTRLLRIPTAARGSSLSPTAPQHHQLAIPFCARFLATYSGPRQIQSLICVEHPAHLEPESSIVLVGRPTSRNHRLPTRLFPKTHHHPQTRWYTNTMSHSPHRNANKMISLSSRLPSQ